MGGEYKLLIHINAHCMNGIYSMQAFSAMHSMLVNTSSVVIKFYNLYTHLIAVYWVFCIIYSTALAYNL